MFRRVILVFACLVLSVTSTQADVVKKPNDKKKTDALDIIPKDVFAAFAIRNVAELTKRGDEFINKTEMKVPMRLSDAYRFVVAHLGIANGLDEDAPAALLMFNPKFDEKSFVLAVPVADFQAMAANFGLKRDDLVAGKIIDREAKKDARSQSFMRYLSVRGDHLLMGGSPKSIEIAATGKSLREFLPDNDRKTLAQDDIVLFFNSQAINDEWDGILRSLNREFEGLAADERQALKQVAEATRELTYAAAGIRLDNGLGASVMLQFKGDRSREILTRLQGGEKIKTSLSALPLGRVLAAHASSGDGDRSEAVARALLHFSLKHFSVDISQFVSAGHRSNIVGVFGDIWQRLEGSRTALYENENPDRDGIFSLVSVLETDDAEQFLADMTGLAQFVNAARLSSDDVEAGVDQRTIQQLIAQLSHEEYRIRRMATTKLGLVGEPALPALVKAMKSRDVEVQFRVQYIRQQITASLAEERKDLLKRDLLSRIKPKFAYFPNVENRSGRPVAIVEVKLNLDEAPVAAQLRRMLGPQWNKIRLATVGNRIVVLLGSDTALMNKAIANVKKGELGIQGETQYASFQSRANVQRAVEFHLSLARTQQLVARQAGAKEGRATSMTSFGLSIAPQHLRFDLFAPLEEVKSVMKNIKW